MRGQVSVGHAEQIPKVGVGERGGRRQRRNDGQTGFFVDHPVQIGKRFGSHAEGFFSVQCR